MKLNWLRQIMQLNKFYFLSLLIFISSCEQPPSFSQSHTPPSELTITGAAHQFIASQAMLLNDQYGMTCGGTGTSLYDGIKKLTWYFDIPRKFTKDEGRAIVIDCITQIVKNANNNQELKLFLIVMALHKKM